jgi:hypothetical protein
MGLKEKKIQQKKSLAQVLTLFLFLFSNLILYNKIDPHQKKNFEEDFLLFITKELVFLSFVEVRFFKKLIQRQNPQLNFPSKEKFKNELLLMITERTKKTFVYLALQSCNTCTISFDLWMSREGINTFILIVHFLNDK